MTGKRSSSARSAMRSRMPARRPSRSDWPGCSLPSSRSASSVRLGPDVAHDLGVREVDLLHVGRRVADMDHLRPALAHDEGRLLDRVVADGDDQVGPVHRPCT